MAVVGHDGMCALYEVEQFALVYEIQREHCLNCCEFSLNNKLIMVGGYDFKMSIYETVSHQIVHETVREKFD